MKYFSIEELTQNPLAQELGIDNTPSPEAVENLTQLVDNVLDPVRALLGKRIIVNSGYRSPELNRAVGGVATSQHLRGEAADITTASTLDNRRLCDLIRQRGNFDQLIVYGNYRFLHVSYTSRRRNRKEFLRKK
ncbi:MAG: D-Ala-D-Ala carboxypeptidase family metallohydrolase [Porphyromonas sp.]|nr:D-Ala-D-Ala carboxypeptidase family metallohydrolase [Porphyromonas sp.]